MSLVGSKGRRHRRRHIVEESYRSSRDRKSVPPHAVFGTGCRRVHLRDDTTTDPRLVTCSKCNTWLHARVQYFNFLLREAARRGPATVPHEAASRFGEVGGSAMRPAGPQLPLLGEGRPPACAVCGNEPASPAELDRWLPDGNGWICDRDVCLESLFERMSR